MKNLMKILRFIDWYYVAMAFMILYFIESRLQGFLLNHRLYESGVDSDYRWNLLIGLFLATGTAIYFKYEREKQKKER